MPFVPEIGPFLFLGEPSLCNTCNKWKIK